EGVMFFPGAAAAAAAFFFGPAVREGAGVTPAGGLSATFFFVTRRETVRAASATFLAIFRATFLATRAAAGGAVWASAVTSGRAAAVTAGLRSVLAGLAAAPACALGEGVVLPDPPQARLGVLIVTPLCSRAYLRLRTGCPHTLTPTTEAESFT